MGNIKNKLPILVANILLVILVILNASGMFKTSLFEPLENYFYDLKIKSSLVDEVDERVVIIDIDEESLAKEGHWPWSRDKLAKLVNNAFDQYGVATLGFDVVFAERDESRELDQLKEIANSENNASFVADLDQYATDINRDNLFAQALANRSVVLGYYFNISPERTLNAGVLPQSLQFSTENALFPPKGFSYGANLPELQEAAQSAGFFSNPLVANDGVVRRIPTVHLYEGELYESFSLAVVRRYIGMDIEPQFAEAISKSDYPALEGLYVGPFYVPIDANGGANVSYIGPSGSFPYVSASDVVRGTVANPETLKDAIVLVGTSSLGLADIRSTPMEATYPGVEIHANAIVGIMDENFKQQPAWIWGAEVVLLLIIGILMMAISPFLGPVKLWIVSFLVFAAVVYVNYYMWNDHNLIVPLANSVVLLTGLYILNVMYGFLTEAKKKKQVKNAFSHYLAPAMVNQLMDNPEMLRLSGESRELTFLFTDIAGFTTFTEKNSPQTLVSVLNEYLDNMCSITISHGGTIDKIIGDALVVMFNAPIEQSDHAERAVRCALEMDEFCLNFAKQKTDSGVEFGITRIGINTGTAIVGNFGGSERFDYTALGDTINTAARMESVNKHLGTTMCISGSTTEQCPDMRFRPIADLVLKGKTEAVSAFQPILENSIESQFFDDYCKAYKAINQSQDQAESLFLNLKNSYPDDVLVKLHLNRLKNGEKTSRMVMSDK